MKLALIITSLIILSSCSTITNATYGLGEKMPTYNGNRCNANYHCFGENRQYYGAKDSVQPYSQQPIEKNIENKGNSSPEPLPETLQQ